MSLITEKELSEKHASLWLKATSAAKVKNWDYVLSLVPPILDASVGFLDGRKLLRHATIQKEQSKNNKKSFLKLGVSTSKAKNAGKKDPAAGIQEVEKLLSKEPFSVEANQLLHDFALQLNLPETATFALETIRKGHPENTKNMHQLAEHYLAQDDPDAAVGVYNHILKIDPSDLNAQTSANHASARASMKKTGLDQQGTDMRSLLKDAEEAKKIEASNRAGMTREQLEAQLAEWSVKYEQNNQDLVSIKKIASLYEQLEQWPEAHSFYAYAFSLSPGDSGLERHVVNAEQKAAEQTLLQLEESLQQASSEEEKAAIETELTNLRQQRAETMVAEARSRVERNPTDPHLRLELANHLYSLGEYSEAIPHLQRARSNPNLRSRTLLLLGKTYEAKNMNDLASHQYEEALADLTAMDSTKKDLLYALALVYEKQGLQEKYLDALKKIFEVDYHYADVAKRVEASYQ